MQLQPRYGDDPILAVETTLDGVGVPMLRQRRRLAELLGSFDDEQWAAPTRCAGWSVQDVVAHLVTTNRFWAASITAGRAGTPTQILASFDPVATPAALVDSVRSWSNAEAFEQFVETTDLLAAAVDGIDERAWSTTLAEAPPGHIALNAVVMHALWDAWVHERDIALPLGIDAVEVHDEVAACLQYAAALGPAFLASTGSTRPGVLRVVASGPDVDIVVEIGSNIVVRDTINETIAPTVQGRAVDLVEGLSFRSEFPSVPDDAQWMMGGLAEVFEVAQP
jgi:uncharacterized protein (TIGR03083 family)